MKKGKKIMAVVSAATLIAGIFAGCGGDEKKENANVTLKYWVTQDGASAQTLSSYNEMLMYQEMSKATGVNVEFIHPIAGSTGQEAFNTMLVSKDLPDMIEYSWRSYAGGADAAIDDGVIIALNDYLEKYAPNYYDYVAGKKNDEHGNLYKAETLTDAGNYYGFRELEIGTSRAFGGLVVRADLLKKWGMEVPETIADWEKLFEKAKSEGFKKPFTASGNPLGIGSAVHTFNTAYDVGKGCYVEDGKVVYCLNQPGYKEYVAQIADWVKKGYIDQNFVTNQSTDVEGNMTNDISIACFGYIGGTMGKLLPAMAERNPEYDLVACPMPVLNKGDKSEFQEVQLEARSPEIAITTACEDIEAAMKWCDYLYSEEGKILKSFGVEGDTHTVEEIDGEKHYIYTDKILKPETVGANSVNGALYKFFRPANSPGLSQHPDYLNGYYPYQCQKDALVTWNANLDEARKHALPTLTFSNEESATLATLNQQHYSSIDTAINEIMSGNKDIDEFDKIVADAEKKYIEPMLKIQNVAYKRYLKKLNG